MIKVKLLIARATATGPQNRGEIVEVEAATAERMVAAGAAEIVRSVEIETTSKKSKGVEKAAK